MVSEEYSDTLQPGMATPCGPAMRAGIMERAKELGLWGGTSEDKDRYTGVWVMNFPKSVSSLSASVGKINYCADTESEPTIPAHEFLHLMENTKPPVKELTTEEKLAEAVRLLDRVTTGHENLMKACGHYTTPEDFTHTGAARAFLKSIEP